MHDRPQPQGAHRGGDLGDRGLRRLVVDRSAGVGTCALIAAPVNTRRAAGTLNPGFGSHQAGGLIAGVYGPRPVAHPVSCKHTLSRAARAARVFLRRRCAMKRCAAAQPGAGYPGRRFLPSGRCGHDGTGPALALQRRGVFSCSGADQAACSRSAAFGMPIARRIISRSASFLASIPRARRQLSSAAASLLVSNRGTRTSRFSSSVSDIPDTLCASVGSFKGLDMCMMCIQYVYQAHHVPHTEECQS